MGLHPLLERQLAKLGLSQSQLPTDPSAWVVLLERVAAAYAQADADRALLERSIDLSTRELGEALAKAEAASRTKGEFLANMSHEIRTPMNAILGYAELLLDPSQSAADRAECVQTIRRSGEHLLGILSDILDLSKIEAGKMHVERIACSPAQIVEDVIALVRSRAESKGLTLAWTTDGPVPATILSDPTRLRQILVNLVGNAVKFTERGGVRISMRMTHGAGEDPRLEISVADTGIGMSPEQVQGLFEPFTQADTTTTRRFGGTGLGLAITRRLAELLGGEVRVVCAPGAGCTFTVSIAAGSLAGATMTTTREAQRRGTAAPAAPAPAAKLAGRILVAEDGPDNQRLILHVLRSAGAEVELAENGRIAVERATLAHAEGRPFGLILMDMQMPELDGYGATWRLRTEGYTRPIVALTAHAMADDREKCLRVGCDDYATKPIDRRSLIEICRRWLDRAAA